MAEAYRSPFRSIAQSPERLHLMRSVVWLVTIGAGFLQVWAARFSVSSDGNCYLDIASAYLRQDWHNAVNAYWSPSFSWLLALCLAVFHPSPYWESTVLHLLNFAALLVSLFSFEFFFRAFLEFRRQAGWTASEDHEQTDVAWWVLGYGLFLSTSLFVLDVSMTMPDVWVAALTYLAVGLVLRIHRHGGGASRFAALGFVLGCAYLTKTFYFPMSFVFLLTAWLSAGNLRKTFKQAVTGVLIFLLVSGPWVAALSSAKKRFTFGDVGKLALVNYVGLIQQPFVWQGENGTGVPKHPVRQLLTKPALFEFATPIAGTYPPAYDQTYWMEGAKLRITLKGLFVVLRQSAGTMFQIFTEQTEYAVGFLFLFFLVRERSEWVASLRKQWFLWVPPLLACLAYTLVLVEGRYVAPFLLLLWISAFSGFLSSPSRFQWSAAALILAMLSVTGLRVAKFAVSDLLASVAHPQNTDFEVAQSLHGLGAQPGENVAGLSRVAEAHWARLAGVKIVAEIPLGSEGIFWTADDALKQKVFQAFADAGAKFIVTKNAPATAPKEGWVPLNSTGFFVYRVPPKARPVASP